MRRIKNYIHELDAWPNFTWDTQQVILKIGEARNVQGKLFGKMESLGFDLQNEAVLNTITLDVLKSSTSQLIANDAMELSLLIEDNSIEDSTQTALKKYARADLLAFQEKNFEAIQLLGEILNLHKGEKIEDEALLKQALLFEETGQPENAENNYLAIIKNFNTDILADNAHYYLAELYANELQNLEKAMEYYEQIIFNFADSIYFVEARKKYRALRGDYEETP
jgi:TolA-binding protein